MNIDKILIPAYLIVMVIANIIVKEIGPTGLWISSFLLIPFDFVIRSILHERWTGKNLFKRLSLLILAAGFLTYLINSSAQNIAIASFVAFMLAQAAASIFYQIHQSKKYFYKVNGSDFLAIIVDSIAFQFIAFGEPEIYIIAGQVIIKFIGGLMWYYIIFNLLNFKPNEK